MPQRRVAVKKRIEPPTVNQTDGFYKKNEQKKKSLDQSIE